MEYNIVKYANIGKVKSGKRLPKGEVVSEIISNNKYIRVRDINGNAINPNDVQYITDDASEKIRNYRVKTSDIIISVVGTVGSIAEIPNKLDGAYLTENCDNLLVDENICLKKYLKHYLISKYGQEQVIANTVGSTQPKLPIYGIENFDIILPNIYIQNKIVKILEAFDNKILINNQTNDNLFKFAISYINNKIEETEVPISKFAKIQGGYAFKSKDLLDDKTNNRIIKIKNLRSEINADVVNSQYVEDEVANSIDSKFKLNKGDVTIAMTGAELGKTGFIYGFDNYYLNQRVGVIRGKNKEGELYLKILFLSNEFQTLLNSKGYVSAQPNISTNDIESILINDIAEENLKDIYERLNSVYYRIISNCEENLNLEQLRDTLLPKLMNGEIDLDKIEI